MKTAIDCYARGKQKEANADDYSRQRIYSVGRFICPECGEIVHLTGSKYSNHFAHYKKTDRSAECDRRIDGVPTQSVYERLGLPIYLRKSIDGFFRLFMGFRRLPLKILEQAERNHVSFRIVGTNQSYRVNRERFNSDGTTLIPLLHVPSNQSNYHIKYEPADCAKSVLDYWPSEADGFYFEGALFSVSGLGGKKVRHGDNISTETEYYWIRRQSILPSFIPGISMNKVGQLKLKDTQYNVFLGTFSSLLDDSSFSRLAKFLRESLRVNLLEKQPAFIPLWPPCLRTEDGYITSPSTKYIFGHIESGNEVPKMYVYRGIKAIPDESIINDEVTKVVLSSEETYINIDRKYVSSGVGIRMHHCELKGKEVFLECFGHKIEAGIRNIHVDSIVDSIVIDLPYDFDYIILSRNDELIYRKSTSQIMVDNIKNVKSLLIVNKGVLFFVLNFELAVQENEGVSLNLAELLVLIQKNENIKKIYIPYKYRILLKQKYPKSLQLEQILSKGEIPVTALKYLGEKCDG